MKSKYLVKFTPAQTEQPIIYRLGKQLGQPVNILRAEIDERGGRMIIELIGSEDQVKQGIAILAHEGVIVTELSSPVQRSTERCTDCGMCVSICPVRAYSLDAKTYEVKFDQGKCIACGLCFDACPPGAISQA